MLFFNLIRVHAAQFGTSLNRPTKIHFDVQNSQSFLTFLKLDNNIYVIYCIKNNIMVHNTKVFCIQISTTTFKKKDNSTITTTENLTVAVKFD